MNNIFLHSATKGILLAGILGLLAAPHAWAANDQTVVLGAGFGVHTFSEADDARKGSVLFGGEDEIKNAGMTQIYLEWYALGNVGFGLRHIQMGAKRTYTGFFDELKQEININLDFLTIQAIPFGGTDYTRFGLIAGVGAGSYEVKETYTNDLPPPAPYVADESADGSAQLVGVFIDWGGEDFGARFGLNHIETNFGTVKFGNNELDLDGSGNSVYFDLRWAWK